jgi:hypothetical protein
MPSFENRSETEGSEREVHFNSSFENFIYFHYI